MFGFQRLDAYRAASEFLGVTWKLVVRIPKGHGDIVDQLRRAALSDPLNIAEGSGKFNRDAVRFYTIARGSALECAACPARHTTATTSASMTTSTSTSRPTK